MADIIFVLAQILKVKVIKAEFVVEELLGFENTCYDKIKKFR